MTKKAKQYPNPRFSSLEEEDEYWKTHSPLDEGYEGKVQKSKQKRSSFLSLRLTGDELTHLRDMAAKFGMGPSTYARQLLGFIIEQKNWGMPYPSFPLPPLYDSTDKAEIKLRSPLGKRMVIFDPDEMKADPAAIDAIFDAIFKAYGARVVTSEDEIELIVEASE